MNLMKKLLPLATLALFFFGCALFSGCALLKEARVSNDPDKAKERVCLNSEGKGRFVFQGQKHVFAYQSSFVDEDLRWTLVIDFPAIGREFMELEWDASRHMAKTSASYEQALLKNSQNINPAILDAAMEMWIQFFEDMLFTRGLIPQDRQQNIAWSAQAKELRGKFNVGKYLARITFLNPVPEAHFGRFDFQLLSLNEKNKHFGMELVVRNCLENPE
ncbi:MAG: hypothetical protein WEB87_00380 [Bacteriovoracaceae bacterium]